MAIKIQGTTVIDDSRNLVNINTGTIAGIQSGGSVVGAGATTINFIGAGNTFSYNPSTKTLDISIQGGGGIGISSDGVLIGVAVTSVNFTGPGVSTVTVSSGIATVNIEGGGGGATIDKQTFNVGAAGTNLLTLTNSYTSGNVDVYLNGLKLSPGDFSETNATTIGLTTAAVSGDTIDVVSFRTVGSLGDIGLRVQQDSVGIGTSISTLNFVGGASTFFNRGNNILDVYVAQGRINKQTFNVGVGGTTLLTLTENYESGKIDVYRNGIRLASGDFSETSANTITLTTRANNGDVVEVQSFAGVVNTNTLSILDNLRVTNITTSTKLHVGIATTFSEDLVVSGNARITGILTIGTGSITLNGSTDTVNVGSGVTITSNGDIRSAGILTANTVTVGSGVTITSAGQIQATSLRLGGTTVVAPGVGIQSAGLVIGAGVTTLNFIGAGNTFRLSGSTVDISISGGGGGSLEVRQAGSNVGYSVTVLDFQTGSRISAAAGIATVNSRFNRVNYIFN